MAPVPDRRAQGSVLLLFPAAVLVLVVIASLAVDRAIVFGAQRELVATAETAANDGAAAGLDLDALRAGGPIRYDATRVDRAVRAAVGDPSVTVSWIVSDGILRVRLTRQVHLIFAPAVPGGALTDERIVATAAAHLNVLTP